MATQIVYSNLNLNTLNVDPLNSVIKGVNHYQRVAFQSWERYNAIVFTRRQGYCNHHVPYKAIQKGIIAHFLMNKSIYEAISSLNRVIEEINLRISGNRIPTVKFRSFHLAMTQEFDDAISNIANDTRNLFYSPYRTGDGGGAMLDYPLDVSGNRLVNGTSTMCRYADILRHSGMV